MLVFGAFIGIKMIISYFNITFSNDESQDFLPFPPMKKSLYTGYTRKSCGKCSYVVSGPPRGAPLLYAYGISTSTKQGFSLLIFLSNRGSDSKRTKESVK